MRLEMSKQKFSFYFRDINPEWGWMRFPIFVFSFLCSMASRRRRRRKLRQRLLWSRPPRAASPVRKRPFPPAAVTRKKRRALWIRSWNSSRLHSWICSIKSNCVLGEIWLTSYNVHLTETKTGTTLPRPNLQSYLSSPLHPPTPSTQLLSVLELTCHDFVLDLKYLISDGGTYFLYSSTSFLIILDNKKYATPAQIQYLFTSRQIWCHVFKMSSIKRPDITHHPPFLFVNSLWLYKKRTIYEWNMTYNKMTKSISHIFNF